MPEVDSVTITTDGVKKPMADVSKECTEMVLEESLQAHSALMLESRANGQGAHSVTRFSLARKFNQEDPIEAAAVERILKTPTTP